MTWNDIVCIPDARSAMHAIEITVVQLTRPAEAVEYVSTRFLHEITATPWHDIVPDKVRAKWHDAIIKRAFIRWEHLARERLLHTVMVDAIRDLEAKARHAGVRLPRKPWDTMRDYVARKEVTE